MMANNEVLDNVRHKIEKILVSNFTNNRYRQKIDVYPDRWNFCCPICGDSVSDNRKKRGNLYLNSMSYHCYNCGSHYGINSLLRKFNEELSNDDKVVIHEIQQNSKKFERRYNGTKSTSVIYKLLEQLAIPKGVFFKANNLISPYKNKFISDYLSSRKIDIRKWKYFAYNELSKELYILNINQNDRIIGYQIRQLDIKSKKPRYLTRSLSRMYSDMFGKSVDRIVEKILSNIEGSQKFIDEEDGIENIVAHIDKLSGLFNIMNVDVMNQLTIVEGPIDSLMLENCVALQGATKMNNYFDNIENIRYLFDNDDAGRKHSIDKIKDHKNVFLWDMYLKEIKCTNKIKDVNDLSKADKLKIDVLNRCFSDNEFDIIMI